MADFDDADQGEEPRLPPALASAEPPADHARSKSFTSVFLLCACLVGLIWTIVLLAFVAVETSVASTVGATFVGAVTAKSTTSLSTAWPAGGSNTPKEPVRSTPARRSTPNRMPRPATADALLRSSGSWRRQKHTQHATAVATWESLCVHAEDET
jgi:hypothetical protein